MADRAVITPELLRQLLRYEPETGKLFWLPRAPEMFAGGYTGRDACCATWNKRWAGKESFTALTQGYRFGCIFAIKLRAHRVAWMIVTGETIPDGMMIDHVNGIRADNRWSNLRIATRAQNKWNVWSARKDSTSGIKGVRFDGSRNRWVAHIKRDGKTKWLGRFKTAQEASEAFRKAELQASNEFAPCQC